MNPSPIIVTGHQPAYLPWLGLIHKASLGDFFIFMDDVQFIKNDFIHRNKIKTVQGGTQWLTIPLDLKAAPSLLIKDIPIMVESVHQKVSWQETHWRAIRTTYTRTPYFKNYAPFLEWFYQEKKWENLAELNLALLTKIFEWFEIKAKIIVSSQEGFTQKKSDLVLEHGERFGASVVVTGALGKEYIEADKFQAKGIKVVHQEYIHPAYPQEWSSFQSHLTCLDLLFNHGHKARHMALSGNLTREELLTP